MATRALLLLLLGILLGGFCRGAEVEVFDTKWNVTAECQMVVVPQALALPLLPELLDAAKIEGAFAKLQGWLIDGRAQLAANLVIKTQGDERNTAESVEEVRYPIEFDPPQVPQAAPNDPEILKRWPVPVITPTAFETRNAGAALEIDAAPSKDGKILTVKTVAQHVRLLRWKKVDAGKLANGERLGIELPIFHTAKNTSQLVLRNGERVLLGVHKLVEPAETLELFLFRISATPAPGS